MLRLRASIALLSLSAILLIASQPFLIAGVGSTTVNDRLAWIAIVPWWLAIRGETPRRAFRMSLAMWTAVTVGELFWIYIAMHHYGSVAAPVAILALLLLSGFVGLFAALSAPIAIAAGESGVAPAAAVLPIAFAATEWTRGVIFTGFPWASLAHSQWRAPFVLQTAEILGVPGLSAVIVLVNVALAESIALLLADRSRRDPTRARRLAYAAAIVLVSSVAFGALRISQVERLSPRLRHVRVSLAQGNVPQDQKDDRSFDAEVRRRYAALVRDAVNDHAEISIWPEAALPGFVHLKSAYLPDREMVEPNPIWVVTGAGTYWDEGNIRYAHNSAFAIAPGRRIAERYDKRHLVPFGEYVPWPRLLFFVKKVTRALGSFQPGESSAPMVVGTGANAVRAGMLICYEDVFPENARETTALGADVLVNVTNDAWYGETSAAWQHASMDAFRAVESRRPLLRVANTGVTAAFDAAGRMTAMLPPFTGPRALTVDTPLGGPTSLHRWLGESAAALAAALTAFLVRLTLDERRRRAGASGSGAFPILG